MIGKSRPQPVAARQELGALLRYWRTARGRSQFELALDTGISQRHISFVESGRSVPGRDALLRLATGLDIPLRERNALLLAAGYAPIYTDAPLDAPEMQGVLKALQQVLGHHEPYPGVVLDRHWNVVMANEAAPRFFGTFIDLNAHPKPRNLLHLIFDPDGLRPFIADWETLARSLFERIHREAVGRILDAGTRELMAALLAYPGVPEDWSKPRVVATAADLPVTPVRFTREGQTLSYFSLITTVGTPQTIAAQELRIECMYPTDASTEREHLKLMSRVGQRR